MKIVSYRNGKFYVDGQEAPAATAWNVGQKNLAKLNTEIEALQDENSKLKESLELTSLARVCQL